MNVKRVTTSGPLAACSTVLQPTQQLKAKNFEVAGPTCFAEKGDPFAHGATASSFRISFVVLTLRSIG
jgi:hypothetical protein